MKPTAPTLLLNRPVWIVCDVKTGRLTHQKAGDTLPPGSAPVYSVRSVAAAKELIARAKAADTVVPGLSLSLLWRLSDALAALADGLPD